MEQHQGVAEAWQFKLKAIVSAPRNPSALSDVA
jgi:hypothetical protein